MEEMKISEPASAAKDIIDRSFAERHRLQEQLNSLGITRRHLTELFEYKYGMSPEQYVAKLKIERSKELLSAGLRATDVAFEIGMESSASFATFFKKHAGMSPSDYITHHIPEHPHAFFRTPLGMMRIEEDESGITSLKFADYRIQAEETKEACTYLNDAKNQIMEYFDGKRKTFDVPLSIRGSDFQTRVWETLREIPYGETRCYRDVAESVGNPGAARAVGMANNRNPILIMIPCHRVIGKSGKPVGYAGGVERKERLLKMEAEIDG